MAYEIPACRSRPAKTPKNSKGALMPKHIRAPLPLASVFGEKACFAGLPGCHNLQAMKSPVVRFAIEGLLNRADSASGTKGL